MVNIQRYKLDYTHIKRKKCKGIGGIVSPDPSI